MTAEPRRALAQKQLDHYNRVDLEPFCRCFHPEVRVLDLGSGRVACEGMPRFREIYEKLFREKPRRHCELRSQVVLGETVLDEEWVTGMAARPEGLHAVVIYGYRDGLIDRVWTCR